MTNNVAPPVPVYFSSSIENTAPAVLTMTYDLPLVNTIVPAASAFSVMVNSVARTVTSVAVSGTDVTLNLSTPVIFGDLVTVAYTQPATNPLQTSIGGKAETLAPQAVDNNVFEIPIYLSSSVENAAPSVLVIEYDVALANTVPAAASFDVTVNSVSRSVSAVSISGTTVLLTLSSPVLTSDILTVAYTPPASDPIQTPSGGMAVAFTAQPVINNVGVIVPVYVNSLIANTAPSVLSMTYSLALDNTVIPDPSAFTVLVNTVARAVSSVVVSGITVSLTLSSPVLNGEAVTVAYTQPATNPLQTADGGLAASMGPKNVTNSVIAVPVYLSSVVENNSTSSIYMTYSLSLSSRRVPSVTAFSVLVNSVARSVTSVSVSGTRVTLRLSSSVKYADIVTVSYTQPASNALQTTAGGKAVSISEQTVTNNVLAIPIYVSSVIENSSPSVLTMTYNLDIGQYCSFCILL